MPQPRFLVLILEVPLLGDGNPAFNAQPPFPKAVLVNLASGNAISNALASVTVHRSFLYWHMCHPARFSAYPSISAFAPGAIRG